MGKFITYISMLIFIDMLFIITGQTDFASLGSILINAILNLGSLSLSDLFSQALGQIGNLATSGVGIASLLIGGAVTLGTIFSKNDSILFVPIALSFGLLTSDIVLVGTYLASFNFILSTLLVAPLGILYILTLVEWVRGKD